MNNINAISKGGYWLFIVGLLLGAAPAHAHTGLSSGWLHPLSGLDHLLAMIAVGAWSCQIGGRAVWLVPTSFVCFMGLGGFIGFEQLELPGTEIGIALSVVLLGGAIALEQRFPALIAAATTAIFGIFHGYAHGYEMPVIEHKLAYMSGFLATTASLHLLGAMGAYLLLKRTEGKLVLRLLGASCALCGLYLLSQVI